MTPYSNKNNEEILTFKDSLKISDGRTLRGHFILKDDFGNIILEKDNLIVMRGRTYALELLFHDYIDTSASGYINNLNRNICLFKIGSGGCDVQNTPFQPFVPVYDDMDMAQPIPFVISDPNKFLDSDKTDNPSIVEELTGSATKKYYLPISRTDNTVEYYGKVFETKPQWVFNKETNEVYKKIMLRIAPNEARGRLINELGLVFAEYDSNTNSYKDAELFSRVTFDTKSTTSLTNSFLCEYLIFA